MRSNTIVLKGETEATLCRDSDAETAELALLGDHDSRG